MQADHIRFLLNGGDIGLDHAQAVGRLLVEPQIIGQNPAMEADEHFRQGLGNIPKADEAHRFSVKLMGIPVVKKAAPIPLAHIRIRGPGIPGAR